MSTLQERLAEAIQYAKCTQTDLAKAVGISSPSINQWFSGRTKSIQYSKAMKAGAFLGVSPHWLATGEGGMLEFRADEIFHVLPSEDPPAIDKLKTAKHHALMQSEVKDSQQTAIDDLKQKAENSSLFFTNMKNAAKASQFKNFMFYTSRNETPFLNDEELQIISSHLSIFRNSIPHLEEADKKEFLKLITLAITEKDDQTYTDYLNLIELHISNAQTKAITEIGRMKIEKLREKINLKIKDEDKL